MKQKSYERIKNFSTSISVERTVSEVERMLAKYGATKIMKEFDDEGNIKLLAFIIMTSKGELPIKLPIQVHKIMEVFKVQVNQGKLPRKYLRDKERAYRVGWRIIKDWLDAQLTLLSIEAVKIEEIFLPYIYDFNLGKTMFQAIEETGFQVPQLVNKKDDLIEVKENE